MGRIRPLTSQQNYLIFTIIIMTKNNHIFKSIIVPKSETDLGYYLARALLKAMGIFQKTN